VPGCRQCLGHHEVWDWQAAFFVPPLVGKGHKSIIICLLLLHTICMHNSVVCWLSIHSVVLLGYKVGTRRCAIEDAGIPWMQGHVPVALQVMSQSFGQPSCLLHAEHRTPETAVNGHKPAQYDLITTILHERI